MSQMERITQLRNLALQDLAETTDEELLSELVEEGEDPKEIASSIRQLAARLPGATNEIRKSNETIRAHPSR